ncbi:Crp/Fnr family transcriptional regulator [Microvirga lotononidis]|uniref:cAMP-binding protein n=1 Tax=Microvirga lotononidis TaxID=864069 RepID=I4Z3K8_9HYPH|nr:Crp/Fnr family transcriptional regulator [Microvirga lotononidis]EIM30800.1 cAMP-binding protein [Microvirga lotononidis]WQO31746.1 Crp/Fnr family transcriptional regulator [Microvirga lotononidis]
MRRAGRYANRLLFALEPDDLVYLEPHLEMVSLRRGQIICEAGEALHHAYFPHDAVISLVTVMENGSTAEMAVCGREGVMGLIPASVTRQAFGNYVVQMRGTASRISLDQLQAVLQARPMVAGLMNRFAEAMQARILQSVACNAVHSVEQRLCRWILSTHHRTDEVILPLTHELLAERFGVQRSTVTTIMGKLQAAGVIQQVRGGITIADIVKLEQGSCECYRKLRTTFERLLPHTFTAE